MVPKRGWFARGARHKTKTRLPNDASIELTPGFMRVDTFYERFGRTPTERAFGAFIVLESASPDLLLGCRLVRFSPAAAIAASMRA